MPLRLWAISDLHVEFPVNSKAVDMLPEYGDDWLIIAGDVGNSHLHLQRTLSQLRRRFEKVIWTPGNHDLWVRPSDRGPLGEEHYHRLIEICREQGCVTPEDPFETWSNEYLVAPIFTLYDYSFRPEDVPLDSVVDWAMEAGVFCSDEALLKTFPFQGVAEWSKYRVKLTEERLLRTRETSDRRLILVSHYPLRQKDVLLYDLPRFSAWCGTKATDGWAARFGADVCIYGHLHAPVVRQEHQCIYAEVSFGYPRRGQEVRDLASALTLVASGDDLFPRHPHDRGI